MRLSCFKIIQGFPIALHILRPDITLQKLSPHHFPFPHPVSKSRHRASLCSPAWPIPACPSDPCIDSISLGNHQSTQNQIRYNFIWSLEYCTSFNIALTTHYIEISCYMYDFPHQIEGHVRYLTPYLTQCRYLVNTC